MKITCGTDIIEIERIKEAIESLGEKFLKRVYTQTEIDYCNSKNKAKYQHFAARFAAKEAVFKALSNKIPDKYQIEWTNIEIKNQEQGKPYVCLRAIQIPTIENIDIRLSHCKTYAVANAIVTYKE